MIRQSCSRTALALLGSQSRVTRHASLDGREKNVARLRPFYSLVDREGGREGGREGDGLGREGAGR